MSMEIQVLAWNSHKNVAGLLVTLNRRKKWNRNLESVVRNTKAVNTIEASETIASLKILSIYCLLNDVQRCLVYPFMLILPKYYPVVPIV